MQQYRDFLDEKDKRFADFLRNEWISVDLEVKKEASEPKLDDIPFFNPDVVVTSEAKEVELGVLESIQSTPVLSTPTIIEPARPQIDLPAIVGPSVNLSMFGVQFQLPVPNHFKKELSPNLTNETIADHWLHLSGNDPGDIFTRIDEIRKAYSWNDWATAWFIRDYADLIVGDERSRVALTWFILSRLGYTVHVGYSGNNLVLIAPANTNVYEVPRYTLQGSSLYFYLMKGLNRGVRTMTRIQTYRSTESQAEIPLVLYYRQNPYGIPDIKERTIRFAFGSEMTEVTLSYDRNRVEFMKNYPETDPSVFFNIPPSDVFKTSIKNALSPLLDGMNQGESINMLLRFVQTGFPYKTDREQFGRQRFMTPDEILYYPFSDCDDRAILFAFLVKELLGLEVVGLEYPGHIATAVLANRALSGDRVSFNGQSWLICDPTYIMADYGMTMPEYRGKTPSPIPVF